MAVVTLAAGLALLVFGAELVVRQGSALATRLKVSPIVVGMTVVALGTSLPELAIGLNAASQGRGELAVGNIVGTNLVNILLILGLAALLRPIEFDDRTLRVDLPMMVGAAVLMALLAFDGDLGTSDGLLLTGYGVLYLAVVLGLSARESRRARAETASLQANPRGTGSPLHPRRPRVGVEILLLLFGLGLVLVGSEFLVDGAVEIASSIGASDAFIGLTVVAIGTSAPELATAIVATVRGDRSLALGNLIGSSVFNIALILGPTVIAAPGAVPVPDELIAVDLLLMLAAAGICIPAFWSHRRLGRVEGGLFVAAYIAYLSWLLATRL
ncbi:calcium/sodium antiporter [Nocardioides sp. Bht2]|uniref:calcium/sodium antiporter n=1 Tax=Nocardioides sp. Bht2 TaxID=3392297 RepID=UPI0039B3FF3B